MATDNPDPNQQAEAFRTPQQVINNLTGETAPDFQIQPSSIDKQIKKPHQAFPALLYKASSTGKTLSVKVTNQKEYDRAISQGWHVGHPVKEEAIVEAEAEGLQPLSILGVDADADPADHPVGEMNSDDAKALIAATSDAAALAAIEAGENAGKARKGVLQAIEDRKAELG